MKRFIVFFLVALLSLGCFALTGCDANGNNDAGQDLTDDIGDIVENDDNNDNNNGIDNNGTYNGGNNGTYNNGTNVDNNGNLDNKGNEGVDMTDKDMGDGKNTNDNANGTT